MTDNFNNSSWENNRRRDCNPCHDRDRWDRRDRDDRRDRCDRDDRRDRCDRDDRRDRCDRNCRRSW